ncbi:hypothetical protein DL98DRAFT_616662 [Cadophora sp. DSE1049]|nr:hypothetical protein DL98DRAFT_616662 [Cadophora sp. DSE1049]
MNVKNPTKVSNTILKFQPEDKHILAILNVNREARGTLSSFLPCRLPSVDPTVSLRFNPNHNQVYITNGDMLLKLVYNMVSPFHSLSDSLCTKSYIGHDFTTLIVNAKHIWGDNRIGGFYELEWTDIFKFLFPNLDSFIAGYIDEDDENCLFEDLDHEYYNNSDDDHDLETDSEDENDVREAKRERAKIVYKREKEGPPPGIQDRDRLTEMIGDFMANVMDRAEKEDHRHFEKNKKPKFYVLHARDPNRELELEDLETRDAADRTDFQAWAERWAPGHLV